MESKCQKNSKRARAGKLPPAPILPTGNNEANDDVDDDNANKVVPILWIHLHFLTYPMITGLVKSKDLWMHSIAMEKQTLILMISRG